MGVASWFQKAPWVGPMRPAQAVRRECGQNGVWTPGTSWPRPSAQLCLHGTLKTTTSSEGHLGFLIQKVFSEMRRC